MSNPARGDYEFSDEAGRQAKSKTDALKDTLADLGKSAGQTAADMTQSARSSAGATVATLKDQAASAADEAKSTIAAVADEARVRLGQMVDDQKSVGADHVASVARAAQAAAGDLRNSSPQLAQLVDTAAERVASMADGIRTSSVADLLGALADFGRRRPVALFGGAVAAGFLLARFVKSDAPTLVTQTRAPRQS